MVPFFTGENRKKDREGVHCNMEKNRKWLVYASWTIALLTGLVAGFFLADSGKDAGGLRQWFTTVSTRSVDVVGKPYKLVLARTYLCGVRDEEHKLTSLNHLAETMVDYKGWEIVSADSAKMILMKREQDISPRCKENGHFGISPDGMLTLFHGVPSEQEVVQTFYRINTAKMEASLSKEEVENLKRGIRVRDLAEYNSILSTYGEFQLNDDY